MIDRELLLTFLKWKYKAIDELEQQRENAASGIDEILAEMNLKARYEELNEIRAQLSKDDLDRFDAQRGLQEM